MGIDIDAGKAGHEFRQQQDPTVDDVKTGFTESAGYGLVASARRGERRLISVVLGAKSDALRTSESQKLLNFGFQAFETRRLYRKGEAVATPEIFKGTSRTLRLGFARDVWLTLPRGRFAGIRPVLETRQPFVAPFSAGQKAGIMRLTRDNATLAEFALVALETCPWRASSPAGGTPSDSCSAESP